MSERLLPWDSEHFGLRIARLDDRALDEATARAADDFCARENVDCMYWLAAADDPRSIGVAEAHGFGLVDIRLTLGRNVSAVDAVDARVRLARPDDVETLAHIAGRGHTDTRFFADERFPRDRAAELYRIWIRKACGDGSGAVFVVENERRVAGYLAAGSDGSIGLVGVNEWARSAGSGSALVNAALDWFHRRGIVSASVVTQGRNVAAQRLYQRAGFLTQKVELWFHRWRRA